MLKRALSGGVAAAIAGAAMLTLGSAPASALTLSSPSLEAPIAKSDVDSVWYYRVWRPRYYYRPHHCWRGYYGRLHCW